MFSISFGSLHKCERVRRSEYAKGRIANKYVKVKANHTVHWKGPIIARYLISKLTELNRIIISLPYKKIYLGNAVDVKEINAAQSCECPCDISILSILSFVTYIPDNPKFTFLCRTSSATASLDLLRFLVN